MPQKSLDFVPRVEYNIILEVYMDYLTAAETAEKWGISDRRVTKLCNEGRVKGAIRKGIMWLIPANTEKPQELKRGVKPTKK